MGWPRHRLLVNPDSPLQVGQLPEERVAVAQPNPQAVQVSRAAPGEPDGVVATASS